MRQVPPGKRANGHVRAFGPKLFTAQVRTSDAEFEKKFQQLQQQWNELERELKKTEAQK